MNITRWHREVRRTTLTTIPFNDKLAWDALGLTGEAGEVADNIKKHLYQGHSLDHDHLIAEMGDVLWYLTHLADALGVTLAQVMEANVAKMRARYPDGWDQQRSIHRDEKGA